MAACRGGVLFVLDDPQGDVPARVGTIATDGVCWYQKLYGGNTPFGWYRMPSQWHSTTEHVHAWAARGNTTANSWSVFGLGAPNGLIAGTTFLLPGRIGENNHQCGSLRTAAVNPSNALVRCGTIGTANAIVKGNDVEFDWDLVSVVVTNAAGAGVATTNGDVRYWSGAIIGNTTEIAGVGSIADSDLIYTAMASQIAVAAGSYGVMWRFSTGAADAGWAVVTANDNGAVSAQTVTQIAAIALLTEYRLRLRYKRLPARTIFASVNDGPETAITLNVGPGTVSTNTQILKPQTIVTCRTALASKSIGWAKTALFFGGC